jgi:hypothetical protein
MAAKGSSRRDRREMAQPVATPQEIPAALSSRRAVPAIVAGCSGLGAAVLLGALLLWFHYGTEVFFDMVVSGLAACF